MRFPARVTVAATLYMVPASLSAQSAQFFSVQASGLLTSLNGESFDDLGFGTGFGGEVQIRVNPGGGFSIGAGAQVTSHSVSRSGGFQDDLTLSGLFLEPRYVIRVRSRSLRPYLAGRIAYLHQSLTLGTMDLKATAEGRAFGAGGGVVVRISRNLNFDLGGAVTSANFGKYTVGGLGTDEDAGSGSSFVLKAGLNLGIGR